MRTIAETIRGISVVIGAETSGLSAALSDVNKKSKDIQSELKQVEKLLKLDPKNTELLAQKQKLLSDAVTNTREKLDRLKAAQQQVAEQFARGEISEGQYRAFQREIVKTEQELKSFESRLKSIGPELKSFGDRTKEASDKLKGIGDSVQNVGEKMSVGVTAPIAAAGAAILKTAADAETAQGKMQASLGLTADEAEKLGEVARQVWKDGFGESIDDANLAIISVRKNMADVADNEMAGIAEGALTIAEIFDQDVNEVTAAAGVMMKNFGINGQEALDLITVGFQKGGDFSGELLDTLREYSPQFQSLGLSADQAMAMLISGAQAGAFNLDKVGDAMKEFNIRAQDGSKTTAEGFAAIGLNADEMSAAIAGGGEQAQKAFLATVTALSSMKDPLAQNQAGVALFGTQWEDVRKNVIAALEDGKNGLTDFRGATDEATKAWQENNPFLPLTQALRSMGDAFGPVVLQLAQTINDKVVPAVKSLADWFSKLSPAGQQTIIMIAGLAAAIGPALIILAQLIKSVGTIIGVFTNATKVVSVASKAIGLMTSPVGLAVLAIAGLAAAAFLIIKNWEPIKEFFKNLWDGVTKFTSDAWNNIQKGLSGVWNNIKSMASTTWNGISTAITTPLNALKSSITNIWNNITSSLKNAWNSLISTASSIFSRIADAITRPFRNIHIPLPHFDFSTVQRTIAGVTFPVPKIDVRWYATGGVFERPAIFGNAGFGDVNEAIVPFEGQHAKRIASMIAAEMPRGGNIIIPVELNGREIARVIAPYIDRDLYHNQASRIRAKGVTT